MSSDEFSIRVDGLSKRYEIYTQPADRLRQMILPRVRRWARRPERSYFHEFWALHDVSFDVHRGETVGIVGRNGSGKSTLLQLICGTLTPTLGQLSVHGRVAALLELGSGFNPEFTGRENAYLNATVLGLSREEIDDRFEDIVAFADIGEFIEQPVKTYSSGMYIRLAFAVAINVTPDILVIDEALSVGDEAFQRKCFARIDAIRDAGATVLFVSHSAGTVIELCDHAILLDRGELLARGTAKFVVSRYHKLLYTSAENVAEAREVIRQESVDYRLAVGLPKVDLAYASAGCADSVRIDGGNPTSRKEEESAYFDEGMVPCSTMRYPSRGALIKQPRIETLQGRQVNVLCPGREYIYAFDVLFQRGAVGVRLGMMIKTVTGLELGGGATAPDQTSGVGVSAGQRLRASFRFRVMLAPGAYFMNAGVVAVEAEGETYLDRIIDVVMFRVTNDPCRLATGTVDFNVVPVLKEMEPIT